MITLSKVANAGQALGYYTEKDDYYREGGSAPARFFGEGAVSLGLSGPMVRDNAVKFAEVLEGRVAGTQVGQADRHTPGWDMTFSASKSVSVAALAGGDDRLVAAHDAAVHAALSHLEQHAIVTRQRGEKGEYVWKHGDGMTAAVFRHTTSRNADPQLHSHVVIANVTRDPETGAWRSLDSRELYAVQAEANAIYMNTLAHGAREAGYTVDWEVNAQGHPTFELREVPEALREAWSSRKAEIDAALQARGLSRETASADEKQVATLATRAPKTIEDRAALAADWRSTARAHGFAPEQQPQGRTLEAAARAAAADAAVAQAVAHLAERDMRFSRRDLLHEARIASRGQAGEKELNAAITRAQQAGALQARHTWGRAAGGQRDWREGYTTREGLRTERALLGHAAALVREGNARIGEAPGVARPAAVRQATIERVIENRKQATGHAFSAEQRTAVASLLERTSGLQILHGYAGTAKTTSVLATIAEVAKEGGWGVRAMAPTTSAAQTLGAALGIQDVTVAKVLAAPPVERAAPAAVKTPALWILDEASMVAAKDMDKLLERARAERAHVVMVGDTKQIGSVGAGAAFTQLREQLGSENLTEIVRQKKDATRQAVYAAVAGKISEALSRISVVEIKPPEKKKMAAEALREARENNTAAAGLEEDKSASLREQAIEHIVFQYLFDSTNGLDTLVIALSRADRNELNAAIIERLAESGRLDLSQKIEVLESKQWTAAQRADAARYRPGDRIEWTRGQEDGPRKGEITPVISQRDGLVTVQRTDGTWTFDPRQARGFDVADARQLELGAGSKIVARAPLQALREDGKIQRLPSGSTLTVVDHDGQHLHLHVRDARGQVLKLDTTRALRLDHGYVMTADAAQGKTCDKVIAWMRSTQQNLASLDRFYVSISRAREGALIVTDSAKKLAQRLDMNRGGNETALTPTAARAAVAPRAPERVAAPAAERNVESLKSMLESARQREGASTEGARIQRNQTGNEWGMRR